MDKAEFTAKILCRYPVIETDVSRDAFISDIASMYDEGWELNDALAYVATFEEVSPDLEEKIAFARRDRIMLPKYIGQVHLREHDFKALGSLLS